MASALAGGVSPLTVITAKLMLLYWIGSGGLLGWVCHIIAAITAHNRGEEKEKYRVRVV